MTAYARKRAALAASFAALAACAASAGGLKLPDDLNISADRLTADNQSGSLSATGNVRAVAAPLRLWSECVEKSGWDYRFAPGTRISTCTNDSCSLHWFASGEVAYHSKGGERYATLRNATVRLFGVPVAWLPYWYYPLDTDYGWRVTPGWTKRWGAYVLTKYVYTLAGSFEPGAWGLRGSTRLDLRSENGIALGQGLGWRLGDFGEGKFKVYYAWDEDADRYDRRWRDSRSWNYSNWESSVPDERYALMLRHRWNATERDSVRLAGAYFSDTHFRRDFLRDAMFRHGNRFLGHEGNEIAWEHVESTVGFGATASGPLNDFYGGVSRLPEAWLDFMPQPLFGLPVNYESSTRAGWLDRDYARLGDVRTSAPFRYNPGRWADYQAFRFDTYHRVTAPFRVADILSVVPRFALRGTFWSDTGRTVGPYSRAGATGDEAWRTVVEGGVTLSARGVARLGGGWSHVLEPYLDVLAQEARYHGLARGGRPFVFDAAECAGDWLDQFAGRSRNLPYSWYGLTPGVRNVFRKADERGVERTVFDIDLYAAVQLNRTHWTEGGRWHRLADDPSDPHYGRREGAAAPGVRARWLAFDGAALSARVECDVENKTVAYADVSWRQELSERLKWELTFSGRDHRWWDYSSSPYDSAEMRNDDFNRARFDYLYAGFEHDVCDALAWGPFVRWDCREGELDEVGAWFDLRTDCLGFRFSVSYENDYERIDRSRADDDWRFGFFIYLRAFGPSSGAIL